MTRTLLLTRPAAESARFAASLPKGWQALIAPMQEMRDLPVQLDLSGVRTLLFTSRAGVASFVRRCGMAALPCLCVGEATAQAARDAGFEATAAGGDAGALIALADYLAAGPYLHLHGVHVAQDIAAALRALGHQARDAAIYDQVALPLTGPARAALAAGRVDAVALFSARSARLLAQGWDTRWPLPALVCLSQAVAGELAALAPDPARLHIAQRPEAAAICALLSAL